MQIFHVGSRSSALLMEKDGRVGRGDAYTTWVPWRRAAWDRRVMGSAFGGSEMTTGWDGRLFATSWATRCDVVAVVVRDLTV
jgi:hypothetical protein